MNTPSDTDLSQGESIDNKSFDAQANLYKQRHDQRKSLFFWTLIASAVLLVSFVSFTAVVLCWIWVHPNEKLDWHTPILGLPLIIVPALSVWHLMRQVFRPDGNLENSQDRDSSTGILWADVLKEFFNHLGNFLSKSK